MQAQVKMQSGGTGNWNLWLGLWLRGPTVMPGPIICQLFMQ